MKGWPSHLIFVCGCNVERPAYGQWPALSGEYLSGAGEKGERPELRYPSPTRSRGSGSLCTGFSLLESDVGPGDGSPGSGDGQFAVGLMDFTLRHSRSVRCPIASSLHWPHGMRRPFANPHLVGNQAGLALNLRAVRRTSSSLSLKDDLFRANNLS